jgi:hypothetical protein
VSIRTPGGTRFCAGTLLTARWVLTAAHCRSGRSQMLVEVGLHSPSGAMSDPQVAVHRVEYSIIHELYGSADARSENDYDLMLLRLERPVTAGAAIDSLDGPGQTALNSPGQCLTIAGWGSLSFEGPAAAVLQKAFVLVWSQPNCRGVYGSSAIANHMLCAGYDEGGVDSCQGDSGGPLFGFVSGRGHVLVGVVSFGFKCAEPGVPGVYMRVASFRPWLCTRAGVGCQAPPDWPPMPALPPQPRPPPAPPRPPPASPPLLPGIRPEYVLTSTMTVSGTLTLFNADRWQRTFAAFVGLPRDQISVAVLPGSVVVTSSFRTSGGTTARQAAERLRTLDPVSASTAFDAFVLSVDVAADLVLEFTQVPHPPPPPATVSSSTLIVVAAIGAAVLLTLCLCGACYICSSRRRRATAPPPPPTTPKPHAAPRRHNLPSPKPGDATYFARGDTFVSGESTVPSRHSRRSSLAASLRWSLSGPRAQTSPSSPEDPPLPPPAIDGMHDSELDELPTERTRVSDTGSPVWGGGRRLSFDSATETPRIAWRASAHAPAPQDALPGTVRIPRLELRRVAGASHESPRSAGRQTRAEPDSPPTVWAKVAKLARDGSRSALRR